MALNCEDVLSQDIQKDCDNKPKAGIEVDVVLINFEDIDKVNSTYDVSNDLIITDLALKSGKKGYKLEGIKQVNGASWELVKKEESFDAYKHTFSGVVLAPSAENKKELSKVLSGGRYVAVVEKKWKGSLGVDAFEVLGWDSGLVASTAVWNTKEADGTIKFELASEDGYEETEMSRNSLETDYDTTKTAFDAGYENDD